MITLDKPTTLWGGSRRQHPLQVVRGTKVRLDNASARYQLWEQFHQEARQALQSLLCLMDVFQVERTERPRFVRCNPRLIEPQEGLSPLQRGLNGRRQHAWTLS